MLALPCTRTFSALLAPTQGRPSAGQALAVSAGHLYVTGWTTSTAFPTMNALQGSNAGGQDAFVTAVGYDAGISTYSYTYSTYLGGGDRRG